MLQSEIEEAVREAGHGSEYEVEARGGRGIGVITVRGDKLAAEVRRLQFTEHFQILSIKEGANVWLREFNDAAEALIRLEVPAYQANDLLMLVRLHVQASPWITVPVVLGGVEVAKVTAHADGRIVVEEA
jgi:hypothetical protein